MREPNRYASLKAEHEAARENPAHAEAPEPTPPPPYVPTLEEQIEGRIAAYEFVQGKKLEAGLLSKTDYFHDLRQLDRDLAREVRNEPARAEGQLGAGGPTRSAEQIRQAEISPAKDPEVQRGEELADKLAPGREVTERDQARIDRLLETGTDERELRHEQEIGNSPSRGRTV